MRMTALLMALVCAAFGTTVHALEQSAFTEVNTTRIDSNAKLQNETMRAWMTAVLQNQQSVVNNILNCAKDKKFWNGTECAAPDTQLTMNNPTVTVTTKDITEWKNYRKEYCCKKVFGTCVRNKHEHQITYCPEPMSTTYTIDAATNKIKVNSTTCTPGKVKWKC